MADRLHETPMEQFERICRERGFPLTVHRRAVLEIMLDREDHPTADQVYAEMRAKLPGISRTSVYRVLEMLVATGMITKVCHPGSAARFDPKVEQHHHLVCMSCDRIIDVQEPNLDSLSIPDFQAQGFRVSNYHVHFRGTCAECLRKESKQNRATRPIKQSKTVSRKNRPNPKRSKS